ncbi:MULTISPECIES: phosphatase PAP2 family protein [unclassified Rhizobium]|uniref:phosphatase PAP2 family protein n=1 Tax=unclassified Rhizobium TaxID=2613769 RepID=UPI001ADC2938|nr:MULTISPECIES: phosphatase PAP2 family protein [unclassified Rhizobium]MBO9124107.1 phosphatase PAP2 family protein [Rhizobium sp. 16-488-2b]MBO9174639.1 phosphatase PAP2 family protein [Rhizobium sp. 16-488-2a]
MVFLPAERIIITVIAALAVLDGILLWSKDVGIDVVGYAGMVGCGLGAMALGQFYRHVRRNASIAATATAAGLFILFTIAGSVFNYLLFPIVRDPVDPALARFDAFFGFNWPLFVEWASHYPRIGMVLRVVYATSLPQLLVVIFVLGFSGRLRILQHFLLTGVIGALLAIICWSFFPSYGASSIYSLPQAVTDAVPLAVGPDYNAGVVELGRSGATYISPKNVLGIIGFPSFHTVMAAMSVVFMIRIRWVGPAFLVLNTVMMPAVVIQGGHNLVDVIGGLVVFTISYALAAVALRQTESGSARTRAASPAIKAPL